MSVVVVVKNSEGMAMGGRVDSEKRLKGTHDKKVRTYFPNLTYHSANPGGRLFQVSQGDQATRMSRRRLTTSVGTTAGGTTATRRRLTPSRVCCSLIRQL